jgi:hypothetical protein
VLAVAVVPDSRSSGGIFQNTTGSGWGGFIDYSATDACGEAGLRCLWAVGGAWFLWFWRGFGVIGDFHNFGGRPG